MQMRNAIALLALCLAGSALAQDKVLTIGDPAPAFKVEGYSKGTPINELKKGNVYVIEFWATWCGPCISAMPHLSDLADKYAGKAHIISINTWDYNAQGGGKEEVSVHTNRVATWVKENSEKMRYNVAYDDINDTMANTWMRAAGRNGIPCAFIVNQDLKIAWIGHPMQMDKPLDEIVNKTWDMEAFKTKFVADQQKAIEAQKAQQELAAAAKAGDMAKFETLTAKTGLMAGVSSAINANPDFAMNVIEKNADKPEMAGLTALSMVSAVSMRSKSNEVKARAVKFSAAGFEKLDAKEKAVGAIYHARTLFYSGDKAGAIEWANKASSLLETHEPANQRESLKKFIEDSKATFNKGQ